MMNRPMFYFILILLVFLILASLDDKDRQLIFKIGFLISNNFIAYLVVYSLFMNPWNSYSYNYSVFVVIAA